MKALLDTCILSELRNPLSAPLLEKTLNFFEAEDLYVSAITIGEIVKGIALLPASKRRSDLNNWALSIEKNYLDRILPITLEVVHIWGEITAAAQVRGKIIPALDGLIAATALANGLHVMTRNTADFMSTGALVINPWEETLSKN